MAAPIYDQISIGAPIGAVLRTDMDAGPAKQRKRFTAAPRPVALIFEPLSVATLYGFENFFENDIASGALAFEMEHPITDVVGKFRFVGGDEPWQIVPIGKNAYRLTVSLELLP
ncbi:hypothetical protein GN241_11025 [Rhodobacteraceae bacterium IMCC1335]